MPIGQETTDSPQIYGGCRKDAEYAERAFRGGADLTPSGGLVLMFLDFPLSFVADTVTLPLTIYAQEREVAAREAQHSTSGDGRAGPTAPPSASLGIARPISWDSSDWQPAPGPGPDQPRQSPPP